MESPNVALTPSDVSTVSRAIPGLDHLAMRDELVSRMRRVAVGGGLPLVADGLYVVLEGSISLQLRGEEIAKAGVGHYFYEEYLAVDDLAVELEAVAASESHVALLSKDDWQELPESVRTEGLRLLFGDLVNVHLHEFQQPINCCNITAAALSLNALGYPCDVNSIFRSAALPVSYVVNEGLTLGELYDVASGYVFAANLRDQVGVELYYLDRAVTSERDLFEALVESDHVGGSSDILVANFDVGIAHGKPEISGGHFALIAKFNPSTGLLHIVDVHPEKYGKIWVTSISRLYEAMADKDGDSMRSRGLMRFILKNDIDDRLSALSKSDCYPVNCTQYIDLSPEKRRHVFGRSSTNLNSLHVLCMSLGILDNHAIDVDGLLEVADLSYTESLSFETTSEQLSAIAREYLSTVGHLSLTSSHRSYDGSSDPSPEAWFKRQLLTLANNPKALFLVNIDYNDVLGFEAITPPSSDYQETRPLEEFWCACVDYLYESDVVILADMSPATSQVWRAPRARVFAGMKEKEAPGVVMLERVDPAQDPTDLEYIIANHELVLFYNDEDPWSYMLKSVLENIGASDLHCVDVGGYDFRSINLRKRLAVESGKERTPYLYFKGSCLGEVDDIMTLVRDGQLQKMLRSEGLAVLMRSETPSLDKNIFSYPKGGLTEPRDGRHNVLLCSCGSSAADKIPQLVEMLVDAGHNVKLIPTPASETFFKDVGMERILAKLRPSDIYRDDDEWNFRYTEFGMPIRAAHLALCDWADCIVVSPVTCNTMGKIAHGVADSLLTSIFVAWQYQRKPVILCPACNTNMWNNLTTRDNVERLKRLGARIVGPRSGVLSNGRIGTGMMATPDEIEAALEEAFAGLANQAQTVMKWGQVAAASNDDREWGRIYRAIDEDVVGIDVIDDEHGDSLLHYASGGEGEISGSGIEKGIPDLVPMRELIARGSDLHLRNDYSFTPLHVAMMNDSVEAAKILLEAGADLAQCLDFASRPEISDEMRDWIRAWARDRGIEPAEAAPQRQPGRYSTTGGDLYFAYGSVKRGFPNHSAYEALLGDCLGAATTRQRFPLVVSKEPSCSNPNCPFLHRMAALVEIPGKGHRIHGELFRVEEGGFGELDELEGFRGLNHSGNTYERKKIRVVADDQICDAYTYFVAHSDEHLKAFEDGKAELIDTYTLEMATGELKPGFELH